MKRTLSFAGVLLLASAITAAPSAQSLDELYAAAKKEGQVQFGGPMKQKETQEILAAFEARFPGIRVTYTRRSTEPMVQLIEADRLANRVSFDLINVTEPGDMVRWKKEGFIAKVPLPDVAKLQPDSYDPDGFYYALGITPMVGILNTNKLKPADAPKSLKELTEPKWKGAVAISRPSRGGTGTAALMNVVEALGRDFLKVAPGLDILLTRGNEAAISSVVSGERPLSWGVSGYRAVESKKEGAPIEIIWWKEGTALANFYGAVTEKAPHPNAARLLLAWLMSKEGQELIVQKVDLYSSRTDVTVTPSGQPKLADLPIRNFGADRLVGEGQKLADEFDRVMGMK